MSVMADRSQIRTYRAEECVVFKKTNERFGGLSNMAPGFPLVVNGVRMRTSEALYQACRFPNMPDVQRLIISQRSPMTAKMRSKPHRKNSRSDWNRIRVAIMRWCLRVKLVQNWQKFSDLLLATEDRPIVEESGKDDFWGAKPQENGTLVGRNILGRLLMELREELRGPGNEQLRRIRPPDILDFLLYEEAIRDLDGRSQEAEAPSDLFAQPAACVPQTEPNKNAWRGAMIPKECKRLAEVDFPIAEVSKHSAREKSIRHGHPSTLHLWWARRPLAACRAMLLGLLLPDPCDPHCPDGFKDKARRLLAEPMTSWKSPGKDDLSLRASMLSFIADFSNWDNASAPKFLRTSRELVKAAHPEETPLVVDPFAGGGSIPLEALRLGCEAFASDLNPVACLILKVMLEDIPRHGPELAEELRRVGKEIKEKAEKELAEFYPKDPDGATPIAYLWARSVRCESPNCGAEIPLMRSFWLCKKASRKRALRYKVVRPKGQPPRVEFEVLEPKSDKEVSGGTVTRAKATCPCCNMVLPPVRVRAQLAEQRGGADAVFDVKGNRIGGARMLAVVTLHPGETGRHYRLPTERDYQAVWKAQKRIEAILDEWERSGKKGLCPVPDEPLPSPDKNTNATQDAYYNFIPSILYGMKSWSDLAAARQKLSMHVFAELVKAMAENAPDSPLVRLLALGVGRIGDQLSSLVRWLMTIEAVASTFGRQALPITWDYCEICPAGDASANFGGALNWIVKVVEHLNSARMRVGQSQQADATSSPLPDGVAAVWFIDPPYYDAIPYASLSDFFYVWLKRTIGLNTSPELFQGENDALTPKRAEIIDDLELLRGVKKREADKLGFRVKDRKFFERKMADAFGAGRRVLSDEQIGCVVFAHKTTEGWEALLSGMIDGGWTITGSWPLATERMVRVRARESAALTTSVHLVCRPRSEEAPVGDWADVLRELPGRVGDWMERLQGEGIRGADLVFACIGPALEIFSRYSRVETADGSEVKLAAYLEKVWETVSRMALEQILGTAEAKARNGAAGAVEEDARLTALFLWTLQSTNGEENHRGDAESAEEDETKEDSASSAPQRCKGFSLVFDVVRRFAQPLGIELPKWEGRIIETKKGVVRLLSVSERAKQLFGEDGADAVADWITDDPTRPLQQVLFPELAEDRAPKIRGRRRRKAIMDTSDVELRSEREATTLDRVHAAMLLQSGGQANALRQLIKAEQERGPDFLRLANALSALYPKASEEKRLLDAMLLAVPR